MQLLQLFGDLLERLADHLAVAEQGDDLSDGDQAVLVQREAEGEGGDRPGREGDGRDGVGAVAPEGRLAGGPPRPGRVGVESVHGIDAGPVGPQILESAQTLFEVAVQDGVGFPFGLAGGDGGHAEADEHEGAGGRADQQQHAGDRLDDEADDEHPDHQHDVAQHLHQRVGEEDDEGLDVAVDPLDQLAGTVLGMPGHLQLHRMLTEPLPEPVPAGPPTLF